MSSELPLQDGKYARIERERRFLLKEPPPTSAVTATRLITDRYLTGTRLRLRRIDRPDSGTREYKLTQKLPAGRPGPVQGLITNLYLDPEEYRLLAGLPAAVLRKTRLAVPPLGIDVPPLGIDVPPLGIDVFDAPLDGLVLAEAEFGSDREAQEFRPPAGAVAEVTADPRFTGGRLVRTGHAELLSLLAEFGLTR